MRMDQQSSNIVTQFFAWLAAIASAAGISTQDLIYIAFGAIGVIVSILSFVLGRIDARAKRRQDTRRTALYENYLNIRIARDDLKNSDAVQHMNHSGGEQKT